MNTRYRRSLFLFRRDLRLFDNTGLLSALGVSDEVVPAFIFDARQTDPRKNEYFSRASFQFLLTTLRDLDAELKERGSRLFIFFGDPKEVVQSLIEKDGIGAVFVNSDYTPFSKKRDREIASACEKSNVFFHTHDDICLSPIRDIQTKEGNRYTVFTPFMNAARTHPPPTPSPRKERNFFAGTLTTPLSSLAEHTIDTSDLRLALRGGRKEALSFLREGTFLKKYKERRNRPDIPEGTSRLSAHHKYGTISIRESYHHAVKEVGAESHFISELYWRDFYYYTAHHFPSVFGASFLPWAEYLQWENNQEHFARWCAGMTGVPLVDAGMRQLNETGFMHNRARMVVASYLTKNLLIDWRWGEKYFATTLIDYDPAQNNGGWQWSASVGADPRPLRIFNPYLQAKEYDPEGVYIQRWVPELAGVEPALLANGNTNDFSTHAPYPAPLVDQKESFHRAREVYKKAKHAWEKKRGV